MTDTGAPARRGSTGSLALALWTLAWVLTLALARFGPELLWGREPAATWLAVGANLIAGAGWIVAHARFLARLDELQRKIQIEALAIGLGVGIVGGFAASAAGSAGVLPFEADIAMMSILIVLVYLAAIVTGKLRYR
jgi:hypothetical protein